MTTRIAVAGAAGRMGRMILRTIASTPEARLAAAIDRLAAHDLGIELRPAEQALSSREVDVLIDFTMPEATAHHVALAAAAGVAAVVGTTGLDAAQREGLREAARRVPIVLAPNMSAGVNVLYKLVVDAARALGPTFDRVIVEAHHRAKKDAPSGTALRLAEIVGEAGGGEPEVLSIRGGDVVGDHTVMFLADGERIEITHRATSRETFARGAVRAALWVHGRPPGLYDMQDVLALR
jgi:4-hydroxy-tetrahydrodipicolinate reductase